MGFDPVSYLIGKQAGGGGGGGNPNTEETVTGTLQSLGLPSGTEAAIRTYNATAYVKIDGTAIGAGTQTLPMIASVEQLRATAADINSSGVSTGAYVAWEENGAQLIDARLYSPSTGVVDVSAYPLPCTTTIIHHPLP